MKCKQRKKEKGNEYNNFVKNNIIMTAPFPKETRRCPVVFQEIKKTS